jgi:hypothetical protein
MAMIEIDRHPSPRALRQFAGLFLVVFGVVGLLVFRRAGAVEVAAAIWGLAVLVGVVGLRFPSAIRWLYVGMIYLAFPLGWVVSHVVLALVFYLLVTPIGLALRLPRRDPLRRRFDRDAATYWTGRRAVDSMDRYFRQF